MGKIDHKCNPGVMDWVHVILTNDNELIVEYRSKITGEVVFAELLGTLIIEPDIKVKRG